MADGQAPLQADEVVSLRLYAFHTRAFVFQVRQNFCLVALLALAILSAVCPHRHHDMQAFLPPDCRGMVFLPFPVFREAA